MALADLFAAGDRPVMPLNHTDFIIDPYTGEFMAPPKEDCNYIKYSKKISSKILGLLDEIGEALQSTVPSTGDIEHIAQATGIHPHIIRNWCM